MRRYHLSNKTYAWCIVSLIFTVFLSACASTANNQVEKNSGQTIENAEQPVGPYEAIGQGLTVVSYQEVEDPLRIINEPIFKFNDIFYRYALTPISKGYNTVVPDPVDKRIGSFFNNLQEPLFALNHLFQGEFANSGQSMTRFVVNTTIGLLGLFDPADVWFEIEQNKTTFSHTLASYGVGQGAYLVLPFIGPSNYRDLASFSFDYLLHPINQINDKQAATHIRTSGSVHAQVPFLSNYPQVLQGVDNEYEFIRNLYMQTSERDAQFYQGRQFTALQTTKGQKNADQQQAEEQQAEALQASENSDE
ncbi:MlaA family lipoprotein [Catenovulum sediminis]|uniref:MlaA family lipoprotein n=1 Tax=Catenovulum sediminis TaxID=1740262 RepID=UPI00117D820A|nr:VacJ family lipoprotein [Catenovulum sediminis]